MEFNQEKTNGPVKVRSWSMERWGITYRVMNVGNYWNGYVTYKDVTISRFFEGTPAKALCPAIEAALKAWPDMSAKLTAVKDILQKGINFQRVEELFQETRRINEGIYVCGANSLDSEADTQKGV